MLDSVVVAYLASNDHGAPSPGTFGERATALVRSYKSDLDDNLPVLQDIQQELSSRGYRLSEVRVLDVLVWSSMTTE
jgi:hypothetical protein